DLASQVNVALFIADYPPENIPDLEQFLTKLAQGCTIAYWSFTQPQKPETLALLSRFVKHVDFAETPVGSFAQNKSCSTELAAFRFVPGDPLGRQLTTLAADMKFWLRQDERATKLADLLQSGYDPRAIVDCLSKGVIWDTVFERERNTYLEKKTKAYEDLMKRLTIKQYLNYRFGFALAPNLLSTADACQHMLDKHTGFDIAVALYKTGKIAFRSRDGIDLDLAKLGKHFGGGGHKYASGGIFTKEINAEHWDETVFHLDRLLKDFFLS
ncbi:MAG: hypothetical protein AABY01_03940, partial [Nanoarchaeota archaeon]